MYHTRLGRYQEKKFIKRLTLASIGIVIIAVIVIVFGLKILIGFSVLVDSIKGTAKTPATETDIFLPAPNLNQLPLATNSADIAVSGSGQAGATLILFIDDAEKQRTKIDDNGTFSLTVRGHDGENTFTAQIMNESEKLSAKSNPVSTSITRKDPTLDLTLPDSQEISGEDKRMLTVSGTTDPNVNITINGRYVPVKSDGTFAYDFRLSDGENILVIAAVDLAGNKTEKEKKATFKP